MEHVSQKSTNPTHIHRISLNMEFKSKSHSKASLFFFSPPVFQHFEIKMWHLIIRSALLIHFTSHY